MSSLINNKEFKLKEISFYIGSLLLAIEYLHKEKIVNRNINPNNIMIILKG
jgi:serine/threonine protein kinase